MFTDYRAFFGSHKKNSYLSKLLQKYSTFSNGYKKLAGDWQGHFVNFTSRTLCGVRKNGVLYSRKFQVHSNIFDRSTKNHRK